MVSVGSRMNDENGYLMIVEAIDSKRGALCYQPMLGRTVWMQERQLFTLDELWRWDHNLSHGGAGG
jgi:hypothetical protein